MIGKEHEYAVFIYITGQKLADVESGMSGQIKYNLGMTQIIVLVVAMPHLLDLQKTRQTHYECGCGCVGVTCRIFIAKSNTQTPTPGLVRWCVKAPLIYELASRKTDDNDKLQQNSTELELIWSKLHLAVLETMLHLRTLPDASQLELLTMVDMNRAVKELVDLYGQVQNLGQITEDSLAQIGVDRLAQCLQISLSTGAFRCSMADLRKILQSLPPSP